MGMYNVKPDTFSGVSDELDERVAGAMQTCWNQIAPDLLVDEEGYPDESASMRRSEVIEVVLDADRLADYDAEAAKYAIWCTRFKKNHWERNLKLRAFPYKTYGY